MAKTSPTARTLQLLRSEGWLPQVVERYLPHARVRQDFLGFADVLAIRPGDGILAVQCTTSSHASNRLHKAQQLPALRTWLECGFRFEVWGWQMRGKRWTVHKEALTLEDSMISTRTLTPRPRSRRARRGERQQQLPFDVTPELASVSEG